MKLFYPSTTSNILHKGKQGNTYRLDGIDNCVRLRNKLSKNGQFIENIQVENREAQAQNLINSVHNSKILEAYKNGVPEYIANSAGVMWQPALYNFALESAL